MLSAFLDSLTPTHLAAAGLGSVALMLTINGYRKTLALLRDLSEGGDYTK